MAPSAVSFVAMAVVAAAILQQAAVSSSPPPPPSPPAMGRPTSCAYTLLQLKDCEGFLSTATGLSGAPESCCGPLRALLGTPESICLCHVYGGGINAELGINIDPVRLVLIPIVCLAIIPPQLAYMCFVYFFGGWVTVGPVPPIHQAPTPPAPAAIRP
ncbi:hypothetical protein HU200_052196 [Digitaria exilis]|uniref:Bifunctional inhibitor/plant lipid transfer protein/seed storage helical domain-containing protein n=1 Tax=Digitaria exilis TaxID=1010633 RepID=A0A835AUL0_9POAL|nr:hypothetical protein HU200_052196 [Digitaria exilis]